MKTRHLLLAAALAGAAALAIFGDRTPDGEIAEPAPRARPAPFARGTSVATSPATDAAAIAALQAREALYEPRARSAAGALFASQDWTPPPPRLPAGHKLPPSAPPLPFTYLGKKIEDGVCEVYLGRGEQSLIVREKTVIDGTWRVDSIKPPTLTLTYLPLNQVQLLIIGGTD